MQVKETTPEDISTIAMLVSESNKDVAVKFGLNVDNCPRHPSFCTNAWVAADLARGERYFIAQEDANPIACVTSKVPPQVLHTSIAFRFFPHIANAASVLA